MTLAQCSIKLPNVQVSDTTKDNNRNADGYITIILFKQLVFGKPIFILPNACCHPSKWTGEFPIFKP
jgi:hypothetical protein